MAIPSHLKRTALAAVLLPIIPYTLWLVLSRGFQMGDGPLDWIALAISVAVGSPFVWRIPWSHPPRGRALLVYFALEGLALAVYGVVLEDIIYRRS